MSTVYKAFEKSLSTMGFLISFVYYLSTVALTIDVLGIDLNTLLEQKYSRGIRMIKRVSKSQSKKLVWNVRIKAMSGIQKHIKIK